MCGIAGYFDYGDGGRPSDSDLVAVRDSMQARGPDAAGVWWSARGEAGLAHRRLSIIDLSESGSQPMHTADGRYSIVFNGEIYNYAELRGQLVSKGYRFRSQSDTEVILHLYDLAGDSMLDRLRGMFAFGLWDAGRKRLVLARDPYGIKPLYVHDNGKAIWFASQVRALLRVLPEVEEDPAGHAGYHVWGHVPEPYTLFRGIRSLEPGTCRTISFGGQQATRRFWNIGAELVGREFPAADEAQADEARESMRDILQRVVAAHMVADVPVGVFLSAGRDSTTLLGLASKLTAGRAVQTVTVGFDEFAGTALDEAPLARVAAERYGAVHSEVCFSRQTTEELIPGFLAAMDQPTVDGFNTFLVSRAAAGQGLKVALSGVGADELFRGYPGFTSIPRLVSRARAVAGMPLVGRTLRRLAQPVVRRFSNPKYASVIEYGGSYGSAYLLRRALFLPWELERVLDRELVRAGLNELGIEASLEAAHAGIANPQLKVTNLENGFYLRNQLLRDTDWASMASSLEVRTPFVDAFLLRDVIRHADRFGWPTKALMAATPSPALPEPIVQRAKTGFAVPVNHSRGKQRVAGEPPQRTWARDVYYRYWLDARQTARVRSANPHTLDYLRTA